MSRRFTLTEARGLLPHVARLIGEAMSQKSQYQEAERTIQSFKGRIALLGGVVVDGTRITEAKTARERCAERMKETIEEINSIGCLVKDLDTGLIDFPTLLRGEEVYLCWKMGESDIEYWHGVHEGFAGRKPITQDFVDHHEGDLPQ